MKTKRLKDLILSMLIAVPIGAVIGGIMSLFGQVLLMITDLRDSKSFWFIPFLALGGMACAFCYSKFGKGTEKGMSMLLDTAKGKRELVPIRLAPMIMVSTWITHLFGGSAGREGVAVQIGGALSYNIGKKVKIENSNKIFLIVGMASGFAGLFQTPLAGVMFAFEVTALGTIGAMAIAPSLVGAFSACAISNFLGLEKFEVKLDIPRLDDAKTIVLLVICAIIFGLVGGGFAFLEGKAKKLAGKIKNPIVRIGAISAALSIMLLLLHGGRYAGLGTNLISMAFNSDGEILPYDFVLKLVLTIITLSAGYQGGEVTPLFSIGASLGVALANLFSLPVGLVAAIGYATVFGAATSTIIAPMLIGIEVFGISTAPYMIVACIIARLVNLNQSIYK